MGFYISNQCPMPSEAIRVEGLPAWDQLPCPSSEYYPVVVIQNSCFESRGVAYDKVEYESYTSLRDTRPKTVYLMSVEDINSYLEGDNSTRERLQRAYKPDGKGGL